jgi:hypothetical protein
MSFEEASPPQNDGTGNGPLHEAALAVEHDFELAAEMGEWEAAKIGDGLCELWLRPTPALGRS